MPVDFTTEVTIRRPREDVFAFVTDPSRLPEWQPLVTGVEVLGDGGPLREGARLRETRQVRGRPVEQIVLVSAFDPPQRFGMRILEGPVPVHGDITFEEQDGSTRVLLHAHGELPRLLRPIQPVLVRVMRREMGKQYARLKEVLEEG